MLKTTSLALGSCTEKKCTHTGRKSNAYRMNIWLDVLHGVKDSKSVINRATWRIDIQEDFFRDALADVRFNYVDKQEGLFYGSFDNVYVFSTKDEPVARDLSDLFVELADNDLPSNSGDDEAALIARLKEKSHLINFLQSGIATMKLKYGSLVTLQSLGYKPQEATRKSARRAQGSAPVASTSARKTPRLAPDVRLAKIWRNVMARDK